MHLIPRQEDGSFAAYYYCSKAELAAADVPGPPPRRHRRDGFSAERQAQFVEHYRDTGSLTDAARLTGISRSTAYNLLNSPDGAAFRDAIAQAGRGVDTILEATAFERCVNGQEEIVYHQGQRVGVRWKYDNKLLMQMLRARSPLKYAPLSEIEGWLKRRGPEPAPDVEGALARLAAAEAEWGRRLPGEQPPPPAISGLRERQLPEASGAPSNSSALPGAGADEEAAIASSSSTLPSDAPQVGEDRHRIWEDEEGWWTDYPPPADFDGEEVGDYSSFGYRRTLSQAEQAAVDADEAVSLARAEAQRSASFAGLASDSPAAPAPPSDDGELPASSGSRTSTGSIGNPPMAAPVPAMPERAPQSSAGAAGQEE